MNRSRSRAIGRAATAGLLLLLLAAACSRQAPPAPTAETAAPAADSMAVWAVSAMERVGRDEPAGAQMRVELWAARGEYEPFQVAVRAPAGGLTVSALELSPLRGPGGASIGPEQAALYREHYVEVRDGSPAWEGANLPLGPGWYADALIPFSAPGGEVPPALPARVEAGQNQPFWVDLFVPRDAPPGRYTGSFTLRSDRGDAEGEIVLTVWDFELPLRPSLLSSFDFEEHGTIDNIKELLRHRLMPERVPVDAQRELIDGWGLAATDLRGFWSGADIDNCAMEAAPEEGRLREALESYERDLLIYNYTADEIDRCPSLVEPLVSWSERQHDAGVATMVTMMPTEELLGAAAGGRPAVDIWVVLPKRYMAAPEEAAAALARGTQLWSYNAGVQEGYSPKWQIDFAPINFRIQPGFISQSLGLSGILYWQIDRWTDDPWNDVGTYSNGEYTFSGDGMFVYPGEQIGLEGIVPSMRLKWVREGVEDYEYVALLKERGQGDFALGVAREVGAGWSDWTQNPRQLEAARLRLGEALSQTSP